MALQVKTTLDWSIQTVKDDGLLLEELWGVSHVWLVFAMSVGGFCALNWDYQMKVSND